VIDHLPPQNIEAEEGVLGGMLQDWSVAPEVLDVLRPGDFYRDSHQAVFAEMAEVFTEGGPCDQIILCDRLTRKGLLGGAGGAEALAELQASVPHAANARYHAEIVRQKAVARALVEAHTRGLRDAYSNNFTAEEMAENSAALVMAASEGLAREASVTLGVAAVEVMGRLAQRIETGDHPGFPTGLGDLDFLLDGLKPRRLYVLAARPSIGKSAMAFGVASHAAIEHRVPVRFVSLEMDRHELAERFLASRANVPGGKLRNPRALDHRELAALSRAADPDPSGGRLVIDDAAEQTLFQIGARARRHKARHGLGLLVVDYLQLIDGQPRKGDSREQEVSRVSRRLKVLAKELEIPVLACCQLNRAAESREDRKPRLADLRESGSIEQDADAVLLLHRPDFYDPRDRPGEADVIVAKHRGGPTGLVKLAFDATKARFDSLSTAEPPFDPANF
jgi:replicative DNA helicase